jgi:hypothetical protein
MPAPGLRMIVPQITGDPSPYGLLGSCAGILYVDSPEELHSLNGTEVLPITGARTGLWQDCPTGTFTNDATKTFERASYCVFDPITVYSGITCSTFGISFDEAQNLALDQLRMGESRSLEQFFQRYWLCPNATDLTPAAGALTVAQGVCALEDWLANNYGGQGVIHAPAGAGSMLASQRVVNFPDLDSNDAGIYTLMGNCVVLGAGYSQNIGGPGCTPAPAGEGWLYITPPVRIRRDRPHLVSEQERQTVNIRTNDRYALAESTFVVEVANCIAAMVRVTLCPV